LKAKEKVCALCLYRLFFHTRPSPTSSEKTE
jgi:hypothetical protein